ncbi:MAG: hypothetical protein IMY67_09700 [Bacteroidetes bacterium]|nr:hypothetical protein [Bacteroidota bacterium]
MKKISALLILLLIVVASCEKDDICAETTSTTPKLILRFYDITSQEDTKNATGLRVTGFNDSNEEVEISGLNIVTTDSIVLPLRTDANSTKFTFHKDYAIDNNGTPDDVNDDIVLGNPDVVTLQYTREDIYVSRACGFKTIFNNLTISVELDTDNWIINSEIINTTIENNTAAHVKIFH